MLIQSHAQEVDSFVDTCYINTTNFFVIKDNIIVPNSIVIRESLTGKHISFNLAGDTLLLDSVLANGDIVCIQLRTISAPLFKKQQLLDTAVIAKSPNQFYYQESISDDKSSGFNSGNGLNYSGSFARGFSIGNRQDLVLSSDLDLQLNGKIGDEIDILAAISDQNIPLQPEGNTQQLREFDKVFIQLSKDKHRLLVGDYEISSDTSYFLDYYKKWQGLLYDDKFTLSNDATLTTSAAAAISRGKYNRNMIAVQEGNQGPYRLTGAEGENFIIIIASTERVYLDGILLVRGIEKDYVIDYNTAEITFTPNLLITKDVRITVDFEYNNQNYLRSGLRLSAAYQKNKSKLYATYYNEQDSRNTSGSSAVGINQKQQLSLIGDNLDNAFGSSIQAFEENDLNPITYMLIDTSVNNIMYDSVLVFSSATVPDLSTAQFSFVGAGQGNYILVPGSNNGTIFQWVAPVDNILQGTHEPIIRLSAPKKTSMLTLGGYHQINKKWAIESELATSNQDENRFSELNNQDNIGLALFSALNYQDDGLSNNLKLGAGISYEYIQEDFAIINPFRNADFFWDWNLKPNTEIKEQHFVNGFVELQKDDFLKVKFNSAFLDNASGIQGFKQNADLYYSHKGFTLLSKPSLLKSRTTSQKSTFWRPNFDAFQRIGKSGPTVGFRTIIEHNERRLSNDSLALESIYFKRYETYIENDPSKILHVKLLLAKRIDKLPQGKDFSLSTTADELNLRGHWRANTSQNLTWNFTARNLKVNNPTLSDQLDLQTYLGKLSYSFQVLKGVLRSTTAYELGSGQENKRSYIYIEVEPGKGIFQWIDYNQDGVQQIEEFEVAPNIDQATFIRVERPTLEFIKTQNVLLNQNLQLGLKPIWFDKMGIKKLVSRFSTTTNVQISRKNEQLENFDFWNPFNLSIDQEGTVSAQSLIRNNLYFNRGNPNFDIYIGRSNVFSAQSLDIGILKNEQIENYGHYQVKLQSWMSHTFDVFLGKRSNDASIFQQRNFKIDFQRFNPALHFLLSNAFNATIQYRREQQQNKIGLEQMLTQNQFNFTLGYQSTNAQSIDMSLTYSEIKFIGQINNPVSFTMLDGLQDGKNLEWQLSANQQVAKNLQLIINYNGRKAGDLAVVHFGNLQLKATF